MHDMPTDHFIPRLQVEKTEKWNDWLGKIPYLRFPANWHVQVIPPFCGAMARFRVKTATMTEDSHVSVYLDCYEQLGCFDEPYWEIYPDEFGETARFAMNDVDGLLTAIGKALEAKDK